jgi:hypothetical protein
MAQITTNALIIATFLFIKISPLTFLFFYKILGCNARKKSIRPHLYPQVSDGAAQGT